MEYNGSGSPSVLTKWLNSSLSNSNLKDEPKKELLRFWNQFYNKVITVYPSLIVKDKIDSMNESTDKKESARTKYKEMVFNTIEGAKENFPLDDSTLKKLQKKVEKLSMNYAEESLFKTIPSIMKMMINNKLPNAKDYLMEKKHLPEKDKELLMEFSRYTLEGLMVHVLSLMFNPLQKEGMVRLATMVERLEFSVRTHANVLHERRLNKKKKVMDTDVDDAPKKEPAAIVKSDAPTPKPKKKGSPVNMYPLGRALVEFLLERELICLSCDAQKDLALQVKVNKKDDIPFKDKQYYLKKQLHVYCNFDVSLLPIQLNLPMISPPENWKPSWNPVDYPPRTLTDLSGGYLSRPMGTVYEQFRLLTTHDYNNFYIDISKDGGDYESLCKIMNKLQSQAFEINSSFLRFIQEMEDEFVINGLLMPKFLASFNIKDAESLLRQSHMEDRGISQYFSYSDLLSRLSKDIQRARYEQFVIKLASVYEGYKLYFPAYVDFRGRIYRCGVVHFHECDLARSTITFAGAKSEKELNDVDKKSFLNKVCTSTAFHFKSFVSEDAALKWFKLFSRKTSYITKKTKAIKFAREAKNPFQFLSNLLVSTPKEKDQTPDIAQILKHPIFQDASASAYQIMSYFLLDESMAKRTNLIPSGDGQIHDIYTYFLEELKDYIEKEFWDEELGKILISLLTRKIVKSLFMPIIYGKAVISTARDLEDVFSRYLTKKDCHRVAKFCFRFWKEKYSGMDCLISLIRTIGWVVSASNRPVKYSIPYYTTIQDYMVMEPIQIWVYERNGKEKKRRRVTLRVSTRKRDCRKSEISTFVNFIHQKDARIAMNLVMHLLEHNAPLYTVHDNFISTAEFTSLIPPYYGRVLQEMGPPLAMINEFIYMNIIQPYTDVLSSDEICRQKKEYCSSVIALDVLHSYLEEHIPTEKLTKQKRERWNYKIQTVLDTYSQYCSIVCGHSENKDWKAHIDEWNKFHDKMKEDGALPYYCVHY